MSDDHPAIPPNCEWFFRLVNGKTHYVKDGCLVEMDEIGKYPYWRKIVASVAEVGWMIEHARLSKQAPPLPDLLKDNHLVGRALDLRREWSARLTSCLECAKSWRRWGARRTKENPAYRDRSHLGNSSKYHTGKPCLTPGCKNPAGTWWSPHWCVDCNIGRIDRVTQQLENLTEAFGDGEQDVERTVRDGQQCAEGSSTATD